MCYFFTFFTSVPKKEKVKIDLSQIFQWHNFSFSANADYFSSPGEFIKKVLSMWAVVEMLVIWINDFFGGGTKLLIE